MDKRSQELLDKMYQICEEECAKLQEQLLAAIRQRAREEMGKGVKVLDFYRGPQPYAAHSGPKVRDFPYCDPKVYNVHMVLPLAVFEWEVGE